MHDNQQTNRRTAKSILVVDDDFLMREIAVQMLAALGYAAHGAASGAEALDLAQHRRVTIDLLFTDVNMPLMTGWELADRFCRLQPQVKVLFASGRTPDETEPADALRRAHCLTKPYSLGLLGRTVRETLAETATL